MSLCSSLQWSHTEVMPCSPNVAFCGYSIPHPTEDMIYVRVQTVGMPVLLSWHCFMTDCLLDTGRGKDQQGLPLG